MAEAQEYDNIFQDKISTGLEKFGLDPGLVKSLSPDELKGLLSAVAKYAIRSRHPDRYEGNMDFMFGGVDARDLSSFAGHVATMGEVDIASLQDTYSQESIIGEYKGDLRRLGALTSMQARMLKTTQSSALELMSKRENVGETIKDFVGTIFCRYDESKSTLLAFDVDKLGRASGGRTFEPVSKKFVSDAEQWVIDLAQVSQDYTKKSDSSEPVDETRPAAIPIVPTPQGYKVRLGEKLVYAHELGIKNLPKPPTKSKINKMFMLTESLNRQTGELGEQLFVEFTDKGEGHSVRLPQNNQIIGFISNIIAQIGPQSLDNKELSETYEIGQQIDQSHQPKMRAKMATRMVRTINVNEFWNYINNKGNVSEAIRYTLAPPPLYSPTLYDKSNNRVTLLGDYYIAV